MNKRITALVIAAAVLGFMNPADAQQPTKVPRIGFLVLGSASAEAARIQAFRQGLGEHGYVEGQNIAIDSAEKPYECFDWAQHERKISNDFNRSSVRPEALEG